jgi:hypothetical protein
MKHFSRYIILATTLTLIAGSAFAVQAAVVKKITIKKTAALSKKAPIVKIPKAAAKSAIDKSLDGLNVRIPTFDLNASPIPNLKITPLNLALPQLPGKGMMKNFTINTNVGYTGGAVHIPMPKIDISSMTPKTPTIPTAPVMPAQPSAPSSAPTIDKASCTQFSGVPSCSYIPDTNGQKMCSQCKSAGF